MPKNKDNHRKVIEASLTEEGYKKLKERAEENCRFVKIQAGIDIERINDEEPWSDQFLIPNEKTILKRRVSNAK